MLALVAQDVQHAVAAAAPVDGTGQLVLDLLIILAAASVVTLLLRRVHLATIPGFLITGAVLGAIVDLTGGRIGVLHDPESVEAVASLATILLLFTIGLHMDLDSIRAGMVHILLLGAAATAAAVLAGWPAAMLFGLSAPAALAVSMALSMSSTAVVLRIIQQRREGGRTHGRIIFGILIVQDMFAIIFLTALPVLAAWAGEPLRGTVGEAEAAAGPHVLGIFLAEAVGAVGVAAMVVFGRMVVPRLLSEAAKESSGDVLLVLSAAVALGAALLTAALGFSPELGAFLAGFILASTPFRVQLAGQLSPMRDLFMAVFFTTIGLRMHLPAIAPNWWVVLLGLIALVSLKAAVTAGVAWAFGASAGVAAVVAMALAQAGEFSLVILSAAGAEGIISDSVASLVIAVVVLSLIATPSLFDLGPVLRRRVGRIPAAPWISPAVLHDQHEHEPPPAVGEGPPEGRPSTGGHIIVAGFGVVGRAVGDQFEIAGIPFTVVELNPGTVRRQAALGRSIVYGDISNAEVLHAAGIDRADAVVLTIPDDDAVFKACQTIRSIAPHVFIAARTGYLSSALRATDLGADHVTVSEIATAEAMARQVMQQMQRRGRIAAADGSHGAEASAGAG